jgi:hypothetical protein
MVANDKTHIRRRVEKELRRSIPDEMWVDLEAKRYLTEAESAEGWSELVDEARRLLRYMSLGAQVARGRRRAEVSTRASIQARARAFSAIVAQGMDKRGGLVGFRQWWGGGFLERDEAIERINSPGWSLMSLDDLWGGRGTRPFHSDDAKFIRYHQSRVVDEEPEVLDSAEGTRWTLELSHEGGIQERSFWLNDATMTHTWVAIPGADPAFVLASPLSLVGGLRRLAELLRNETTWSEEDSAWFSLTGDPPVIEPLLMSLQRGRDRSVVRLEIEPWIPQDEVLAAYRQAQRELLPHANHLVRERSGELARFIATGGRGMTTRAQMKLWNSLHPDWIERDPRNFARRARHSAGLIGGD